MSATEDWTLGLTWNWESGILNAIIHGAQDEERINFVNHLDDSRTDTCHPMLLPVILCEMLADADSNGARQNAIELFDIELRTRTVDYLSLDTVSGSQLCNVMFAIAINARESTSLQS
jgi:hypothetical protein